MNNELYHYGVRGMKWGVRRYQNSDGTLTAAGKKKARQEYRSDNKTAYELGKNATIAGRAAARSVKRTVKLENKLEKQFDKDPEGVKSRTKSLNKRWDASAMTTLQLSNTYMTYKNAAEQHCKRLVDKYGEEAVSSIKYKDVKIANGKYSPNRYTVMNERTNNLSDYARAGAKTMASVGISTMLGAPVAVIFSPKTTYEKARDVELTTYYTNLKQKNSKSVSSNKSDADREYESKVSAVVEKHNRKMEKAKQNGTYTEDMEFDMWDEIDRIDRG